MALPELLLPPGTPAFLADGHAVDLVPLHADVQFRTGHSRRRRIYTVAPQLVTVGLQLTQAQMAAFDAWFEGPLQAGALSFTAAVANQGAGLLYWQARFEAPYQADPGDAAGIWTVTAQLRLIGTGSATPPTPTNLADAVLAQLVGTATLIIANTLADDVVVALLSAGSRLADDVVIALTSIVNGAPASNVDFEKRWIWMCYPYSQGRTSDITDVSEFDQRSWFGLGVK